MQPKVMQPKVMQIIVLQTDSNPQKLDRLSLLFRLVLGFWVMLSWVCQASSTNLDANEKKLLLIFTENLSPANQALIQSLELKASTLLPDYQAKVVTTFNFSTAQVQALLDNAAPWVISIGPLASQKLLAMRNPKFNYFILEVAEHQLNQLHQTYRKLGLNVTGIFQEQPFDRQLKLCLALGKLFTEQTETPDKKQIFYYFSPEDRYHYSDYAALSQGYGQQLSAHLLNFADNPNQFFTHSLQAEDCLLLAQNSHFNPASFSELVVSAFYQGSYLIGNNRSHLDQGALASIYTPSSLLARQSILQIKTFLQHKGEKQPGSEHQSPFQPVYSADYQLAVNEHLLPHFLKKNSPQKTDRANWSELIENNRAKALNDLNHALNQQFEKILPDCPDAHLHNIQSGCQAIKGLSIKEKP